MSSAGYAHCATTNPLADTVRALWAQPPGHDDLTRAPAFKAFLTTYLDAYPNAGSRQTVEFALREALRRLGLGHAFALPWQDAAKRLDRAARATSSSRLHLCPLDWAGEIPAMSYGPNEVKTFTRDELAGLIVEAAASPIDALKGFDLAALAQFQWLVVREVTPIASSPGSRALPALFNMSDEYGRIEPHRRRFPVTVERALFCLLAISWEELTQHSSSDWRPFQIPWIYTLDDDLFARPPSPPNPASLTWTYKYYDHDDGEVEEIETPLEIRLDDFGGDGAAIWMDDEAWNRFERAETSALLTAPVLHFFITGLLADGIDEFIAHVATIEASLGQASDHKKGQPELPNGRNGATARTAWRLGQLLDDPLAAEGFRQLFKLRSRYIHGELMEAISGNDRTAARRLARRCVCALVAAACTDPLPADRPSWLGTLIPEPAVSAPKPKGKRGSGRVRTDP